MKLYATFSKTETPKEIKNFIVKISHYGPFFEFEFGKFGNIHQVYWIGDPAVGIGNTKEKATSNYLKPYNLLKMF
jgi:hypothetical protein